MSRLHAYIDHYFAPHPSQEVKELFMSTAILDFATGMIALFEPIFLFKAGFSIPQVLLFYAAMYLAYLVLLPLGGHVCRRHGNEHTMLLASPFLVTYYVALYSVAYSDWALVVAVFALAVQKVLYWPGYHANFAAGGEVKKDGREVANAAAIAGFVNVLAPAVGGFLVVTLGFPALFLIVSLLIFVSNLPLLRTPEVFIPQPFSYKAAWARLANPANRHRFLSFFAYGEQLIAMIAWPLYVMAVIPSAVAMGLVISLSQLFNVFSTLYMGRVTDEEDGRREAVVRSGALYTALSWIIRPLMSGGLGVFLSDSFYRISHLTVGIPLLSLTYGEARQGDVMETAVFLEMALAVGKVVAAVLTAVILYAWPNGWAAVFVLAAVFTSLFAMTRSGKPLVS
jgi:hypothetical protein